MPKDRVTSSHCRRCCHNKYLFECNMRRMLQLQAVAGWTLRVVSACGLLLADIGYQGCEGPIRCHRNVYIASRRGTIRKLEGSWLNDLMNSLLNGQSATSIRIVRMYAYMMITELESNDHFS